MAESPEMRASDSDRDRVAEVLREHYAEGRLTVEEFDERLDQLYRSKTYGELEVLTADLPGTDLRAYTERAELPAKAKKADQNTLAAAWTAWALASGVNWVIWVLVGIGSDGGVYPWPLWVMGPWGVILLVSTVVSQVNKQSKQ